MYIRFIIFFLILSFNSFSRTKFDWHNFNIGISGNFHKMRISVQDQGGLIINTPFLRRAEPHLCFYVGYDINKKHRIEFDFTSFTYYTSLAVATDPNGNLATAGGLEPTKQIFLNYRYFLLTHSRNRFLKNFKLSVAAGAGYEKIDYNPSISTNKDSYYEYNNGTTKLIQSYDYYIKQDFYKNFYLKSEVLLEYLLFKGVSFGFGVGWKQGFQNIYTTDIFYTYKNVDYHSTLKGLGSGYYFAFRLSVYLKSQRAKDLKPIDFF